MQCSCELFFVFLSRLSVTFYVKTITNTKQVIQKGTDVVAALKKKLRTDSDMIDYRIKLLDTLGETSSLILSQFGITCGSITDISLMFWYVCFACGSITDISLMFCLWFYH